MDLLRDAGELPKLVGHRGASALAPENTMASFKRALADGADIVELDVRVTADGVVIVMHDDTVDRTTDGSGGVSELTLEEIQGLDAGSWFHPRFAGEPVPTLAEVLGWAQGRVELFLEIKYDWSSSEIDPRLVPAVVDLVAERAMVDEVALISFNVAPLVEAATLLPGLTVGPMDRRDPWGLRWAWLARALPWLARFKALRQRLLRPLTWTQEVGGTMLSPDIALVTPVLVEAAHDLGMAVSPGGFRWDYPAAIELGVDTISSNDPGEVKRCYLE